MLQENSHGRNRVVASRVIRIDQEVWAELQRRAVAFEDNPNSVLRRILGLSLDVFSKSNGPGADNLDPRVAKLLDLVESRLNQTPVTSPTKTGQSFRFRSQRGKVVAFIYRQRRRLKIESSEQLAKKAGINNWNHWLRNGWWNQDNSVYWYIPDDDDGAYDLVAGVLDKLWRH